VLLEAKRFRNGKLRGSEELQQHTSCRSTGVESDRG